MELSIYRVSGPCGLCLPIILVTAGELSAQEVGELDFMIDAPCLSESLSISLFGFTAELFFSCMLGEVELADHRPVNGFDDFEHGDFVGSSCELEAASRTSFASEYVCSDKLLQDLEEVLERYLVRL